MCFHNIFTLSIKNLNANFAPIVNGSSALVVNDFEHFCRIMSHSHLMISASVTLHVLQVCAMQRIFSRGFRIIQVITHGSNKSILSSRAAVSWKYSKLRAKFTRRRAEIFSLAPWEAIKQTNAINLHSALIS
jgi:hypothetical protein